MRAWQHKIKFFWTIWAIGWNRQKTFNHKIIEFQIFLGPMVITFWR